MPEAIKVSGGADFKKLTKESKILYSKHASTKGSIKGLRLRDEDSEVLREMAEAIWDGGRGNPIAIAEAKANEILKDYMP